jgi:hypothetical protein
MIVEIVSTSLRFAEYRIAICFSADYSFKAPKRDLPAGSPALVAVPFRV